MFSIRCFKEHLQNLMPSFKKQDNINKNKSRTEEEYDDLKVLLESVIDLSKEYFCPKKYMNKCTEINPGTTARNESLIFSQLNTNNELPDVYVDSFVFEVVLPDNEETQQSPSQTSITSEETATAEDSSIPNRRPTLLLPDQSPAVVHQHAPLQPFTQRKRIHVLEYLNEKQRVELAMKREELPIQQKILRLEETALAFQRDVTSLKDKLEFEKKKKKSGTESKEREPRLNLEMEEKRKITRKARTTSNVT